MDLQSEKLLKTTIYKPLNKHSYHPENDDIPINNFQETLNQHSPSHYYKQLNNF